MLSKEREKTIKDRVRQRYHRMARKLGDPKSWKTIELDGKNFADALEFELSKELELSRKNEVSKLRCDTKDVEIKREARPRGKSPLDWLANPSDAPKGTSHADECQCPKCMGGFGDEDLIGPIPESDEGMEARKELENKVNEQLEEFCTRNICPLCKSSVCRCEREGGE